MYHYSNSAKNKRAVALEYQEKVHDAPKVVASGRGLIAEKIIEIARENNIPLHSDADLVEILALLEIDEIIPVEVYSVVAEIFSHIYEQNEIRKQNKMKR